MKLSACWEGLRDSRLELGDVMSSLHLLVERSELQHVANQLLSRPAFASLYNAPHAGGQQPLAPVSPLCSPRARQAHHGRAPQGMPTYLSPQGMPSYHTPAAPPHHPHAGLSPAGGGGGFLPQDIPLNHRHCVKRGSCTCAERLALALGTGDPYSALERIFERQLRLLLGVRKLWRHAEYARGELPAVPKLPPLPPLDPAYQGHTVGGAGVRAEESQTERERAEDEMARGLPRHFSDLYLPEHLYAAPLTQPTTA